MQGPMESLIPLLDHARGAWRFRWAAMAVAWAVCLVGWVVVLMLPDTFEASARVFVDTRTTLRQVTQGITVDSSLDSQINRVRQALLGGPQLDKVSREANVLPKTETTQARQEMLAKLRERIHITGSGEGVYVISYQDTERGRSLRVVDRLLNTFVEGTLGGNREGSEHAQRFLVDQIAEYERRLASAEQRLATFKKQNVGMMPGAQGDYFTRLQAEMEAMSKSEAALRVALTRREAIEKQRSSEALAPGAATAVGGAAGATDELSLRIRDTQAKLDDLLLRFTEKHPDVIALRATLTDLQTRRNAELEAVRRGDMGAAGRSGLAANPVFQSIQLQLNQADVEIAALRGEIADRQAKVSDLRKLVDTAPDVEAEYARLNRDYDVTRAQYQSLVERLEKARFSEEAEQTGIVRFEVIDPPTAAFKPVAPQRPQLIIAVLFLGIAAGAALAFLLHLLKPVFSTARQLADVTGLQVLGVVSITWLEKHQANQRNRILAYAGVVALLVVFAGVMFLYQSKALQLARSFMA